MKPIIESIRLIMRLGKSECPRYAVHLRESYWKVQWELPIARSTRLRMDRESNWRNSRLSAAKGAVWGEPPCDLKHMTRLVQLLNHCLTRRVGFWDRVNAGAGK